MLKTSGELLSNGLAMVIEFQKAFQSVSKNLGSLAERLKQRQLLSTFDSGGGMPDFVRSHARKLMQAPTTSLLPNATVAQDGSGQFKSIQEAVNTVPLKGKDPFVILVKAGVYKEYVLIPKGANHITMIGEGPLKTRITGDKCFKNGFQTYDTSTLSEYHLFHSLFGPLDSPFYSVGTLPFSIPFLVSHLYSIVKFLAFFLPRVFASISSSYILV